MKLSRRQLRGIINEEAALLEFDRKTSMAALGALGPPAMIAGWLISGGAETLSSKSQAYWKRLDPDVKNALETAAEGLMMLPGAAKASAKKWLTATIEDL